MNLVDIIIPTEQHYSKAMLVLYQKRTISLQNSGEEVDTKYICMDSYNIATIVPPIPAIQPPRPEKSRGHHTAPQSQPAVPRTVGLGGAPPRVAVRGEFDSSLFCRVAQLHYFPRSPDWALSVAIARAVAGRGGGRCTLPVVPPGYLGSLTVDLPLHPIYLLPHLVEEEYRNLAQLGVLRLDATGG